MPRESHVGYRAPSAVGPNEAMVASQQQHITDLVSQNKTLEHMITKLRAAVAKEEERATDLVRQEKEHTTQTVAQIQERWKVERTEWRDGCESLQTSLRIAHLRTAVDMDREHVVLLETKDALRRERLAKVQRDYRLVMFQAKELELEERIAQLQRDLEKAVEEKEDAVEAVDERMQETAAVLEARCAELAGQLKEMAGEQAQAVKAKEMADVRSSHSLHYRSRDLVFDLLGRTLCVARRARKNRLSIGTLCQDSGED